MKWVISFLGLFSLCVSTAQAPTCNLGEYKYIATIIHHPVERKDKILIWLKQNGSYCNKDQIEKIYNSLAYLLGTSDDAEIRSITYELYSTAK